jgi:predicted transcriptional regulator of viral defense system
MSRNLSKSLAPIIERLELEQPEIVTLKKLSKIAVESGVFTAPTLIAHRLVNRGWLLKTGISGAWEFAPAAFAGAYSRGGPLIAVNAIFQLMPDFPGAIALSSAAWMHGLADRAPPKIELAVKPDKSIPAGLSRKVRILRFSARLTPNVENSIPVHRFESILVHLAANPTRVNSWGGVVEWLPDLVAEAVASDIILELKGRSQSTRVRLAYLLEGLWPELSEIIGISAKTKVWFGPREKLRRHSQRWQVADTILPFDPATLPKER